MRINISLCAGSAAVAAVVALAVLPARTQAWPEYLDAWIAKYPTSTLPQRMELLTGAACHTCHTPPDRFYPGTCYRMALRERIWNGMSIQQALDAVHDLDSDGDGVPNGVEILMQRSDDPTQIGYHPGLVGPTGRDPCAIDPNAPVSNQNETPAQPCYANCDGSTTPPILNVEDFSCFINRFAEGTQLPHTQQVTHYANCDNSTTAPVLNVEDFSCFINQFAQGCR
jgi:hypothetical protein